MTSVSALAVEAGKTVASASKAASQGVLRTMLQSLVDPLSERVSVVDHRIFDSRNKGNWQYFF
jgi:hypothetical protein